MLPALSVPDCAIAQNILVVEADRSALDIRAAFLEGSGYKVTTAHSLREIESQPELSVAILSLSFGPTVLRDTAESIRRRWPRARILVVGDVQFAIDDHLYDESVHHSSRKEEFLEALAKISEPPVFHA